MYIFESDICPDTSEYISIATAKYVSSLSQYYSLLIFHQVANAKLLVGVNVTPCANVYLYLYV